MEQLESKYIFKYLKGVSRHDPSLWLHARRTIEAAITPGDGTLGKLLHTMNGLAALGMLPKQAAQKVLACVVVGIEQGTICFFSMNSHALRPGTETLRNKPQYLRNRAISAALGKLSAETGLRVEYVSVLPDVDPAFPLPACEALWESNRVYIQDASQTKAIRLTTLADRSWEEIWRQLPSLVSYERLLSEIHRHESSYTLPNFAATNAFARNQILSYVATGLILERAMPWGILLDVQKKRYPFEQAYYSFGRQRELPIIFCGQAQ